MPLHATGRFENKSFDENEVEQLDGGAKVTSAHIVQSTSGDLDGELTADLVMYYAADGTATYLGFQRFTGTIDGRSGGLVMRASGGYDGKEARVDAVVVDGWGEFADVRGQGFSSAGHGSTGKFEFDFTEGI